MTNRTGKREREARNRHKRTLSYNSGMPQACVLRSGPMTGWAKLGHKKLSASFRRFMAAVPVADSRKPKKKSQGAICKTAGIESGPA